MKGTDLPTLAAGSDRPVIVTAADRRVTVPLAAMLRSLQKHSPDVDVVVLAVGLSQRDEMLIRRLTQGSAIALRIIRVEPSLFARTPVRSPHLTRTAYAPILLPEIFPDLDRVIWLDVDTIVLADLLPLWRLDLRQALVAGVADDFISREELQATGTTPGTYFNSGVMVVNLSRWRRQRLAPVAARLMHRPDLICEDQSVLNMLCRGQVLLLDRRWNFHAARFHEYAEALRPRNPAIMHYCGHRKPWCEKVPFQRLFLQFLPREMRSSATKTMASLSVPRRLELARRRCTGMLLGRPKHWRAFAQQSKLMLAEFALDWALRWKSSRSSSVSAVDGSSTHGDAGQVPSGAKLLESRNNDSHQAANRVPLPSGSKPAFLDQ